MFIKTSLFIDSGQYMNDYTNFMSYIFVFIHNILFQ